MGCVLVSSIRRAATSRKPGRCPTLICRRTFRSSTWEAMVTRWFTQPVNSSRLSSSAFLDPSNVATVRMEVLSAIAPDVERPFGKKAKRQNSRCRFWRGILNFRCDDLGGAALSALGTNGEGKRLQPARNSEAEARPSRHPNRRPEGLRHLRATATPLVCSTPCQAGTRRTYPSKQPLPERSPNFNAYFC